MELGALNKLYWIGLGFFFRSGSGCSGSGYYVLAWLSFYFTFYFLLDTILPVCCGFYKLFTLFFVVVKVHVHLARLLNRYVLLDAVTGIAADIASVPVWFFYLFCVQMDLFCSWFCQCILYFSFSYSFSFFFLFFFWGGDCSYYVLVRLIKFIY